MLISNSAQAKYIAEAKKRLTLRLQFIMLLDEKRLIIKTG